MSDPVSGPVREIRPLSLHGAVLGEGPGAGGPAPSGAPPRGPRRRRGRGGGPGTTGRTASIREGTSGGAE